MNILLISASPRKEKSATFLLAKEVLRGCGCGQEECEIVHLCDLELDFCLHCESCHDKILNCPIEDDVHVLLKKMLKSDGMILASPNYINQVTGAMKTLFDRSSHFIHCKRLMGKYVAGVVSSGSGQDKEVTDYLAYYAHTCGAQYSGSVSSAAYSIDEKKEEAFQLGQKLLSDIKDKKEYPDQIRIIEQGIEHFRRVIEARKDEWKEEYQYWQDKGWL